MGQRATGMGKGGCKGEQRGGGRDSLANFSGSLSLTTARVNVYGKIFVSGTMGRAICQMKESRLRAV